MAPAAVLACLLWSSAFVGVKIGLRYMPPLTFAGVRFVVSGLLLAPFWVGRGGAGREILRNWRLVALVAGLQTVVLYGAFFVGMTMIGGAQGAILLGTYPLVAAVRGFSLVHNPVRIASLGSGPGHEILSCLEACRNTVAVRATCVDMDEQALQYGRGLAEGKGFQDGVRYIRGNVLKAGCLDGPHDVAVLSGLLDYFDYDTAVSVLRNVHRILRPRGMVLAANMRRHGLAWTMSVLGNWRLVYREPDELAELLTAAGYGGIQTWLEPEGVFCLARAARLG